MDNLRDVRVSETQAAGLTDDFDKKEHETKAKKGRKRMRAAGMRRSANQTLAENLQMAFTPEADRLGTDKNMNPNRVFDKFSDAELEAIVPEAIMQHMLKGFFPAADNVIQHVKENMANRETFNQAFEEAAKNNQTAFDSFDDWLDKLNTLVKGHILDENGEPQQWIMNLADADTQQKIKDLPKNPDGSHPFVGALLVAIAPKLGDEIANKTSSNPDSFMHYMTLSGMIAGAASKRDVSPEARARRSGKLAAFRIKQFMQEIDAAIRALPKTIRENFQHWIKEAQQIPQNATENAKLENTIKKDLKTCESMQAEIDTSDTKKISPLMDLLRTLLDLLRNLKQNTDDVDEETIIDEAIKNDNWLNEIENDNMASTTTGSAPDVMKKAKEPASYGRQRRPVTTEEQKYILRKKIDAAKTEKEEPPHL